MDALLNKMSSPHHCRAGTYTGLTEADVEAAGGIDIVAMSYRESGSSSSAASSSSSSAAAGTAPAVAAAVSTGVTSPSSSGGHGSAHTPNVNRSGVDAALGIGPGTGNPLIDGDGLPGTSSPDAVRPPFPDARKNPGARDMNVLRRTVEMKDADISKLVELRPEVGDYVDVRCPDYCWRKGQIAEIVNIRGHSRVMCLVAYQSDPTTSVEMEVVEFLGNGNLAPMGTYSDTVIHDLSKVRMIGCLMIVIRVLFVCRVKLWIVWIGSATRQARHENCGVLLKSVK